MPWLLSDWTECGGLSLWPQRQGQDDRPLARLDPVHMGMTAMTIQSFEKHRPEAPENYYCTRTQPMADTCPIYPGSLVHKLGAYPQESDLPS
jgi:hypothetical protein